MPGGYIPDQQSSTGQYVPTTNVWDVSRINEVEVTSPEFKELIVKLYQNINNLSLSSNAKITGYCLQEQFVSGKQYYNLASNDPQNLRPSFFTAVDIGVLNAGAKAVNHNLPITNTWKMMSCIGSASNTGTLVYYPLPFAGAAGNNIEVSVTSTQVLINNASGVTFTDATVVLEFVKF